jgi:hypothetical protein
MKTMIRRTALTSLAILAVLAGTTAAFAYQQVGNNSQPLSFTIGTPQAPAGYVVNLGDQMYTVSGGKVVLQMPSTNCPGGPGTCLTGTSILGQPLSSANVHFSLNAQVQNLQVSGFVSFSLTGMSGREPISVSGSYSISNAETSTPANAIQNLGSGTCTGRAANACSELPLSFVGQANVQVQVGNAKPQYMEETMMVENPYLNPFGAPIVIASSDFDFVIVATYNVGNIMWTGVQVAGPISGTFGSGSAQTPVTGTLTLSSFENENLVTGTATDSGSADLVGMTPTTLNVNGTYTGTSVIPTSTTGNSPEQDCSPNLGFAPSAPGTGVCTETGFNSIGKYTMSNVNYYFNSPYNANSNNGQETVVGSYNTTWTSPALAFSTTSTATVTNQPYY